MENEFVVVVVVVPKTNFDLVRSWRLNETRSRGKLLRKMRNNSNLSLHLDENGTSTQPFGATNRSLDKENICLL